MVSLVWYHSLCNEARYYIVPMIIRSSIHTIGPGIRLFQEHVLSSNTYSSEILFRLQMILRSASILLLLVIELGSNSELKVLTCEQKGRCSIGKSGSKISTPGLFLILTQAQPIYVRAMGENKTVSNQINISLESCFHSREVSHAWVAYGPSWLPIMVWNMAQLPIKPIDLRRDRWTNKGGWADFWMKARAALICYNCSISTSIPLPLNNPHPIHYILSAIHLIL